MLPVVVGGTPGSGKTSLCKTLAVEEKFGVHLETDYFFKFLASRIDPSRVESKSQNEAVVSAYCAAARAYANGGYVVFVDGVIGPWLLPEISAELGDFHYLVLHASLPVTLSRMAARPAQLSAHPSVAERMHSQFEAILNICPGSVINTEHHNLSELVVLVREKIQSGECVVSARNEPYVVA